MSKTTFYSKTETGGICFRSTRRPGDVRIPNYVYDLWMPLLGAVAIGVYGTYCRLERSGSVKAIKLVDLARACRIGTSKLAKINDILVECGFITLNKPTGLKRVMHWTTEIIVHDPAQDIPAEIIEEYAPEGGYHILSPWLMDGNATVEEPETEVIEEAPENPNGNPGKPKWESRKTQMGTSEVEDLESLNLTTTTTAPASEKVDEQFSLCLKAIQSANIITSSATQFLIQGEYDDLSPPADETKLQWFQYAVHEAAANCKGLPTWKYIESILRRIQGNGSLATHKILWLQNKNGGQNGNQIVQSGGAGTHCPRPGKSSGRANSRANGRTTPPPAGQTNAAGLDPESAALAEAFNRKRAGSGKKPQPALPVL